MKKIFSLVLAIAFLGLANTFAQCSMSKNASSTAKASCSKVCSKTASSNANFDFTSLEQEGFALKQCSQSGSYSASKTCSASGKITSYNQCSKSGKITKTVKTKDGLTLSKEVVSGGKEVKTAKNGMFGKKSKAACSKSGKKCCAKKGTASVKDSNVKVY